MLGQQENASMQNELPAERALLSRGERRILLEDIGRIGLALGRQMRSPENSQGDLPFSPQGAASLCGEATPLERLAVLQALWPDVKAAIQGIIGQPNSKLLSATTLLPLARSRG